MEIVKSSNFGSIMCDFYRHNNDIFMTREQIGYALNYSDPIRAISKIHARNQERLDQFSVVTKLTTTDGKRYATTIYNQKGIFEICRWSRQDKANEFMDWVWDVIESIRKHGAYMTPEKIEEVLLNPDTIIQLATNLKEEQQKRLEAERTIRQQKPKVLFADAVETSESSVLVGELSKILRQNGIDIGQNRLFAWLRENGYLIRKKGESFNLPTQRSMDLGLFEIKKRTINNPDGSIRTTRTPKVTGKGQIYFVNKFLAEKEAV